MVNVVEALYLELSDFLHVEIVLLVDFLLFSGNIELLLIQLLF